MSLQLSMSSTSLESSSAIDSYNLIEDVQLSPKYFRLKAADTDSSSFTPSTFFLHVAGGSFS